MTVVWVFLNMQVERIFYSDFRDNIDINYKELGINKDTVDKDGLLSSLQSNLLSQALYAEKGQEFTVLDKFTGEIVYSSDPLYQA